ncbi:hypothetical protein [Pelagibacterium sp. H642]|uniref:hypothetical protein n=1 Tax=Pelagibacterium sp. H642 TaxID=1881069 RepID=UPI0028166426|nr:hypothetical protein [Pelagibacterium sp. H642]WMT92701.1 hypothetical protein NO934_20420 [Pelagibacterium sp. H642]
MIPAATPAIAARQLKLAGLWLLIDLSLGIFMSSQRMPNDGFLRFLDRTGRPGSGPQTASW